MTQVLVREEVTEAPSATSEVRNLPSPGWYGTVEDLWLRYWSGTDWVDPTTRAGPPPGPEARTRNVLGLPEATEQRAEAVAPRRRFVDTTKVVLLMLAAVIAGVFVTTLGILVTT